MACDDSKYGYWHQIPAGSTYQLKVSGPAGFAAYASFDEAGPPPAVMWPHADIAGPAPKRQPLGAPDDTHIIRVYLAIASVEEITVKVEASVTLADGGSFPYCFQLKGAKGAFALVTHVIRMRP